MSDDSVIRGERWAVASYLRSAANAYRDHARRLLADTTQNKPDADREEACARALDNAADAIEQGRHWR